MTSHHPGTSCHPSSGRRGVNLAVAAACAFLAQDAIGDDLTQGNALNRTGLDPALERDARGMSPFLPAPSRTPTGMLYDRPFEPPPPLLPDDWNYRLSTEFGVVATPRSDKAPAIRNYGDYGNGFVVNYFSFGLDRPGTAHYLDITAGAVGREDQHYRATFGRYGDFRTSLFFNQIPVQFTDRARTVFAGGGTGNLTLVPGLTPGNNTPAQVNAALQSQPLFELGYDRRKGGIDFESTPGTDWRLFARYSQEQKKGTRPSGAANEFPGVPAFETIEPLDYRTHDVAAGVQWATAKLQANLAYSGSFFRNGIDTLTWENPLLVGDPAVQQRGRMDLYPDNDFHNVKLDLSAPLPMRGRVTGGASVSRMTQNDDLIAPTVNSGTLGGINLADWNTTGALSQKTAGARIDTLLAHLGGSFSPFRDLSLQAKLRHFEQDNKTSYAAFNPQTGQTGYLGNDGGINNIVPNNLFRAQIRSIPFEYKRDNYSLEGDYRLLRRTNVTLGYERENTTNAHREYGKTGEDRVRLGLNNRDIPQATLRLSYEHANRSGDAYNFNPNSPYYSGTSVSGAPAGLADLRKYDIADRRQHILNARVTFLVARDMDLAVSGKYVDNEYGAAYGRLDEQRGTFNVEWSWQPAPRTTAWAHYGYERLRNRMASISDDAGGYATGDPDAGGAVYPFANRWEAETRDESHTLGLGLRHAFTRARAARCSGRFSKSTCAAR